MSTEMVNITIDGRAVEVAKGTLIIRAAEQLGIHIPRFCDHPLLDPAGACRQCLVEVAMPNRDGVVQKMPKPQAACTMTCTPGMEVSTQRTSDVAKRAQEGQIEFLLINHPLDCPICDKGGECPLQNQALTHGNLHSRFTGVKRTWPKPVELSAQILLDRERCILCQRCVRFSKQIAGDPFIALQGRGGGSYEGAAHHFLGETIGPFDANLLGMPEAAGCGCQDDSMSNTYGGPALVGNAASGRLSKAQQTVAGAPFASYFSGNTIQICPVGALTSKEYRFRSRPFDLTSTRGVTEQDASGAAIRTDVRRGQVVRRMAQRDMDVNEEWITDKDRFAFHWQFGAQRLTQPLVREDGKLVPTSWGDALDRAAQGIRAAASKPAAALPGGRLSFEDALAWSKFARTVLRTNSIDQRTRAGGDEEQEFLGAHVAGTGMRVTYSDLEAAKQVLLIGFEAEDECGAVFLRLRKAQRDGSTAVAVVAPLVTPSSTKMSATVLKAAPGMEVEVVEAITQGAQAPYAEVAQGLGEGGVIVLGERAAATPGLLSAAAVLADQTGAKLAWIPRRAGERGGVEAGLLPTLLPFGRLAADPEARADLAADWGTDLPADAGLDTAAILATAQAGGIGTLLVGGVDYRDLPAAATALQSLRGADFVVSLEVNLTPLAQLADVVLPVAPPVEKPGTFINWEGRLRPFGQVLTSVAMPDREVLQRLAFELDHDLGMETLRDVHAQANAIMDWDGARATLRPRAAAALPALESDQLLLACHKPMLDDGLLQADSPDLARCGRLPVAFASAGTLAALGIQAGQECTIATAAGQITLPAAVADMAERVVWVPECSPGSHVHETLGAGWASPVTVAGVTEVTR